MFFSWHKHTTQRDAQAMKLVDTLRQAWAYTRASIENPGVPLSLSAFLGWMGAGEPTAAGEVINIANALQITTVYRCVRLIAESVASLPLVIYELKDDGTRTRVDHDLTYALSIEPNDEMSAPAMWEAYTGNMAAAGNGYAEILRDSIGMPAGLYPLSSGTTNPRRNRDGALEYVTSSGMPDGRERVIPKSEIVHTPLFCFDGLKGFSPITLSRQMLGLAKATEKFGARFFGNGAFPSGVLSPEQGNNITDKQKADLKESWERNYGGENQRRVAVLTAPWKWQAIGISPEDSQFIGTQAFTRSQIAGLFGVSPSRVGDMTRMSNNNHEQESLSFVTDTLRGYSNRIEKELMRKMMPRAGRKAYRYIVEFDYAERLRTDFKTTQEGFALGRQWGWLSANDVRRAQGMNPIGNEGDIYLSPLNMLDARKVKDMPAPGADAPKDPQLAGGDEGDDSARTLGRYAAAHGRRFVDAFRQAGGDVEALRGQLAPAVGAIADAAAHEHPFTFWPDGAIERIAADAVDSVCRRMRRQGARFELTEQLCRDEFRRVVRSVHINAARESAAIAADRELTQEVPF
jgi:HK97 family phage portal protein